MSVNTVLLVGHLGARPELRTTPSGKSVCDFRLATNRWRRDGGKAEPDWHRIVAWERTADNCHRYLDTGHQVAVEGHLITERWESKQGERRVTTKIVAHRVTFLNRPQGAPSSATTRVEGYGAAGVAPTDRSAARPPLAEAEDLPF